MFSFKYFLLEYFVGEPYLAIFLSNFRLSLIYLFSLDHDKHRIVNMLLLTSDKFEYPNFSQIPT